jgi:hypothetical protein
LVSLNERLSWFNNESSQEEMMKAYFLMDGINVTKDDYTQRLPTYERFNGPLRDRATRRIFGRFGRMVEQIRNNWRTK